MTDHIGGTAGRIEQRIQAGKANLARIDDLHAQAQMLIDENKTLSFWNIIRRDRNATRIQLLLNQVSGLLAENDQLEALNFIDLNRLAGI